MTGSIFNIQPYSIHDGPGIRTTVFLKGCPLRCLWCQNPESQKIKPQLMYYQDLCKGCGVCVPVCPYGAVSTVNNKVATDRTLCTNCGACTAVCPAKAREITGQYMEAKEVADKACADKIFFLDSGGGVTLSGGEVLAQPEFAAEILYYCKENGVHTAVETTGFASWEKLHHILQYADLVLYDFKHMDAGTHKRIAGVDNGIILENAKRVVHELGKEMLGRVPLIPGFNDSDENLEATARFIATELYPDIKVHILPYNSLGESKNSNLEQEEDILHLQRQPDELLEHCKTIMSRHLNNVVIGG